MQVRVAEDADGLATTTASLIAKWLREASGSRVSLGLAGGSTPRATYERLVDEDVPWDRVGTWLGDERWVPPQHPESNGRMVRRSLLDHVPARFHPIPWQEGISPWTAASAYDARLTENPARRRQTRQA